MCKDEIKEKTYSDSEVRGERSKIKASPASKKDGWSDA